MTGTVLIAGASGKFGSHCMRAFAARGWEARAFKRGTEDLAEAARGMDVIVNAMNLPDYLNWDREIPRITGEVIAAARSSGAAVLIPGNVYNFGIAPAPWSASTPQAPNTRKGRVRAEMEAAYRAAGIRVIVLRAGDFMGAGTSGTWLDLVMLAKLRKGRFVYPGDPDQSHAWAYLPDLARAAALLAERRDKLPLYADIAFPGYTLTGREMMEHLARLTGRDLRAAGMAWWPLKLASPFWRFGRELLEMRYLWDHPHWLDGADFEAHVPGFEPTDVAEALAAALPPDVQPNQTMIGAARLAGA